MLRSALLVLFLASPALAQAPHREGEYGGVNPSDGTVTKAERPKHKKMPRKGTLAWVGFEARNGGAEVFLQSPAQFDLTQTVDGSTLVLHLSLSKLGRSSWRHIDTRFFDNPLSGIVARKAKGKRGGIDVRVKFKNPKDAREATLRTATEADGMYYVYLSFPEGADSSYVPPRDEEPER